MPLIDYVLYLEGIVITSTPLNPVKGFQQEHALNICNQISALFSHSSYTRTLDNPCTLTVKSPNDFVNNALRSYQCGANIMFCGRLSFVHDAGQNYNKRSYYIRI